VAFVGYLVGNKTNIWILIKISILLISMVINYTLTGNIAKENEEIEA